MDRLRIIEDIGDEIFGNNFWLYARVEQFLQLCTNAIDVASSVAVKNVSNGLVLREAECSAN